PLSGARRRTGRGGGWLRQEMVHPGTHPYRFFFTDPAPSETYTLSLHDALPIFAAIPGDAGTDQKLVGDIAVQHQRLGAVEHEAGAVAARAGGHVGEMIARLALAVRERQQQAAVADLRQQRRALLVAAAVAQQPAAEHHRGEER